MERYHLAKDRISEICIEKTAQPDFEDFFKKTAAFLTKTAAILEREKEELTEEEHSIYKRGRNSKSVSPAKNQSVTDYRRATGFEAVMGYLYLKKDYARMMELVKMGLKSLEEEQ